MAIVRFWPTGGGPGSAVLESISGTAAGSSDDGGAITAIHALSPGSLTVTPGDESYTVTWATEPSGGTGSYTVDLYESGTNGVLGSLEASSVDLSGAGVTRTGKTNDTPLYVTARVSDGSSTEDTAQVSVTPEAGVSTSFTNEPAGFVALTDNDWNTLTGDGWLYSGANSTTGNYQSIVTLSGADLPPVNGPDVLRAFYQEGTAGGYGTGRTYYSLSNLDEVFVGMWHKFDADFVGSSISMKMFFFLFGGDRSFLGYEDRPDPDYSLGHAFDGFVSPSSGVEFDPLDRLPYGEWYKLEWYWKRNSAPGVGDGILQVWMNDTLYMDLSDVEWPASDMTQFYHEGTHGNTLAADMAWYVARTRISVPE